MILLMYYYDIKMVKGGINGSHNRGYIKISEDQDDVFVLFSFSLNSLSSYVVVSFFF